MICSSPRALCLLCCFYFFLTAHAAPLASFRGAYTAAKRLTVSPAPSCRHTADKQPSRRHTIPDCVNSVTERGFCVVVEVQFSGPQSAERPALLLTRLFQAGRVAVHPVALRRGRKRCAPAVKEQATAEKGDSCPSAAEVLRNSGKINERSHLPSTSLLGDFVA